jgi:tetratricopeptide (TPR) repeat protein
MFLGLLSIASAQLDHAEKKTLFDEGETAFRDAGRIEASKPDAARELYQKAALRWERLAKDDSTRNGAIHYNLGNVYVKLNDLGRAILNYRRAQLFTPNDPNLERNLDYARRQQEDRLGTGGTSKIKTVLLFWHYDVSPTIRTWIFTTVFILFWAFMILRVMNAKAAPTKLLIVLAAVGMAFAASLMADHYTRATYRYGVVTDRQVTARKGDGQNYQPSFSHDLHSGLEFRVLDRRNGWLHVELADSRDCWIPDRSATLVRP